MRISSGSLSEEGVGIPLPRLRHIREGKDLGIPERGGSGLSPCRRMSGTPQSGCSEHISHLQQHRELSIFPLLTSRCTQT